jgi:membrane protein implicated in regulation of membrane protease activity
VNPDAALPLRDIHLPDPVSWWPPAPGWWLLLVLSILLIVGLIWLVKRWRRPVLRKRAREELESIFQQYQQHGDRHRLVQQLSVAIRRVVMSYAGRSSAAGVTGAEWHQRINQLGGSAGFSEDVIYLLSRAPYQKQPQISDEQVSQLESQFRAWLSALSKGPIQKGAGHV